MDSIKVETLLKDQDFDLRLELLAGEGGPCAAGVADPRPRSDTVGSWTGVVGARRRNRPYLSFTHEKGQPLEEAAIAAARLRCGQSS
jgi:hypothetical protein